MLSLAVAALAFTTYSCKDFTELDPLASLSESTAFVTPENVELAVNGMYWQAAVGYYDPLNGTALQSRGYPFGGASIEQGEMRGEDMMNIQAFFAVTYQNTYTPNTANNVNMWEQLYALVNQCNVIIEGVDNAVSSGVLEAAAGDPYKGEALFLRALAHHELLLHFSRPYADNPTSNYGVPYRTKANTGAAAAAEGNAQPRGTVKEAYDMLLADLDLAESLLPNDRGSVGQKISRATKGAAIALKTRVKLHMQDYPGVITEATKLGANATSGAFTSPIGGFALETDPTRPFLSYADNTESIFSVAQSSASNGGVNGAISSMFSFGSTGRNLVGISPNFYNSSFWLATDKRKTDLAAVVNTGSYKAAYLNKYRKVGINDDWNPIVRYAEVLLNAAEAYAFEGNNAQALRLLNAVRDRSVGAANSYGTTAPADLKLAIYQERRIEFLGEGRRWGDLHRLAKTTYGAGGIPAKVLFSQVTSADIYDGSTMLTPAQPALSYEAKEFLWPIPQSETDANPTLREQQNPGW